MAVQRLKRCPRCGGNMFLDRDWSGWYEECLQCSAWRKVENIAVHEEPTDQTVREPQSWFHLPGYQFPKPKANQ